MLKKMYIIQGSSIMFATLIASKGYLADQP